MTKSHQSSWRDQPEILAPVGPKTAHRIAFGESETPCRDLRACREADDERQKKKLGAAGLSIRWAFAAIAVAGFQTSSCLYNAFGLTRGWVVAAGSKPVLGTLSKWSDPKGTDTPSSALSPKDIGVARASVHEIH